MTLNAKQIIVIAIGALWLVYFAAVELFGSTFALWLGRILFVTGIPTALYVGYLFAREWMDLKMEYGRLDLQDKRNAVNHQVVEGGANSLVFNYRKGTVNQFGIPRRLSPRAAEEIELETDIVDGKFASAKPVMPLAMKALTLAVYGEQNAGKTTFLQWLIYSRGLRGTAIAIDPHYQEGKYPEFVEVHGAGRNYGQIDQLFVDLMTEIDARYKEYDAGKLEQDFDIIDLYVDECTLLHKHCGAYKDFMGLAVTETRKIGFRLTVCVHSDRLKILGLDGMGDASEGLLFVALKYDEETGERWCEVQKGRTKGGNPTVYASPGPFYNYQNFDRPGIGGGGSGKQIEFRQGGLKQNEKIIRMDRKTRLKSRVKKVANYIKERGMVVTRLQLLSSKVLGEKATKEDYDETLDTMIDDGIVDLERVDQKKHWRYKIEMMEKHEAV